MTGAPEPQKVTLESYAQESLVSRLTGLRLRLRSCDTEAFEFRFSLHDFPLSPYEFSSQVPEGELMEHTEAPGYNLNHPGVHCTLSRGNISYHTSLRRSESVDPRNFLRKMNDSYEVDEKI